MARKIRESMKVDYSIVVPVYYNETTLEYTESRIRQLVFEKVKEYKGEIIFVDDGSGDASWEKLKTLQAAHPQDIRLYKLSRNFGQGNAVRCGCAYAEGAVIQISADGQDPVELIPQMLSEHFKNGKEVVIAYRQSRDETWWRRLTSKIVYTAIRKLGHPEMPTGGFDFILLGRRANQEFLRTYQPHTFFQVNILKLGFSRAWLPYHRENRKGGTSKWTFAKKFTYMVDGVLGHSYVPIRLMTVCGLLCSAASFVLAALFFISYLIHGGHVIKGWTPIVLMILFVGGVQMMMIGVIGEYLWRVLAQVRNDAPYIVDEEVTSEESN